MSENDFNLPDIDGVEWSHSPVPRQKGVDEELWCEFAKVRGYWYDGAVNRRAGYSRDCARLDLVRSTPEERAEQADNIHWRAPTGDIWIPWLYGRGLTDETVARQRFYATPLGGGSDGALNVVNFRNDQLRRCGSILCLPHFDPHEACSVVNLLGKPWHPRRDSKGGEIKYERPRGVGQFCDAGLAQSVYFPVGFLDRLRDETTKLVVAVESPLDALLLWQLGFCVFATGGVNGWSKPRRGRVLNAAIQRILSELKRAGTLVVCFDSDVTDNENVAKAAKGFAAAARRAGVGCVGIVQLPDGAFDPNDPEGSKVGPADFLLGPALAAVKQVKQVKPSELVAPVAVEPERLRDFNALILASIEAPTELQRVTERQPIELALEFRDDPKTKPLAYWSAAWWEWREEFNRWTEVGLAEMHDRALGHLNVRYSWVTKKHATELVDQLRAVCRLTEREAPTWLDDSRVPENFEGAKLRQCVLARNLVVEPRSGHTLAPTSDVFNTSSLDIHYDPTKGCERWYKFLDETFDTKEERALLQEVFGYLIVPDTSRHKVFALIGASGSGKSVIVGVLNSVLGSDNVSAATIESLAGRFGLAPHVGKSLTVLSEFAQPSYAAAREGLAVMKRVSGEDPVEVDRKGVDATPRVVLSTRFLIVSNEVPRLPDASGAVERRLVALEFKKTPASPDKDLPRTLANEASGILNWAIEGLRRLERQGDFTHVPLGEDEVSLVAQCVEAGSPVGTFVRECCDVGQEREGRKESLFATWRMWCERHNEAPGPESRFHRELKAFVPGLRETRPRVKVVGTDGEARETVRVQMIHGIALKPPHEMPSNLVDETSQYMETPSHVRLRAEGLRG